MLFYEKEGGVRVIPRPVLCCVVYIEVKIS
jgi:hypothetical protein